MAAYGFFGGPAGRPFKIAKTFDRYDKKDPNNMELEDLVNYKWNPSELSFGDFVQVMPGEQIERSGSIWAVVLANSEAGERQIPISGTNFSFELVLDGISLVEGTILKGADY